MQELLDLLADTKKQLEHLRVLGVEGIRPAAGASKTVEPVGQAQVRKGGLPPLTEQRGQAPLPDLPSSSVTDLPITPVPDLPITPGAAAAAPSSLFGELAPAPPTLAPSTETFEQIHAEIGDCTRCPLHQERTHVVHTEGNRKARLMFVGEAPGADEDIQARPFVGRAGQLLTKIIEAIGLKREEVLIGNVNRCRPPGNRAPTAEEAAMCKPFLLREIGVVQPEVIVVLGNTAMKNLLDTREGITRLRGRFQDYKGIKVMPTFHPAYLLRDPSKKRETWEDLKQVRDYLDSSRKS
jgi:uracil-DNA glycosylase